MFHTIIRRVVAFVTAPATYGLAAGVLQSLCSAAFIAGTGTLALDPPKIARAILLIVLGVVFFVVGAYAKGKSKGGNE